MELPFDFISSDTKGGIGGTCVLRCVLCAPRARSGYLLRCVALHVCMLHLQLSPLPHR